MVRLLAVVVVAVVGFVGPSIAFAPSCRAAAGDIVVTLTVTGKGVAAIGTVMSDQCEGTLTARLLYQPDPETGRYGDPVEEQYTMAASGNGHVLDIESWTYGERQPSSGAASLTYLPSEGKAIVGWGYLDDYIRSEPEGGQGSERMARTDIKIAEDRLIMQEDAGVVTFAPNAADFTASGSCQGQYSDMFGGGEITASYSVRRQGEELEAVIIPPPDYLGWLPTGGSGSSTPGTNPVVVMAELRLRGTKAPPPVRKATFKFQLIDGSKEPGICMNFPPQGEAKSEFDLQFGKSKGIEPTEQKQIYQTEEVSTSSSAIVLCYDYGAHARVRVTAITDMGEEIPAHLEDDPGREWLDLPEDKNENHIADSWERAQGIWGEVKEPDWDESDEPKGQEGTGDGISLYEKYRGFRFDRDHERLRVRQKHVFIYDPNGVVHLNLGSAMSFAAASQLQVRFVENGTWTGAGTSGSKKRIVNFNTSGFGHATDQHALHVRVVNSKSPTVPKDYEAMWKAKYGNPLVMDISRYYGMSYDDVTGVANMESPGGALVIELYPWGFDRICRKYVRYHTFALPQFADYAEASAAEQTRLLDELTALANDYIQSHYDDWEEQNFTYLLAGASHELGHGVSIDDLVPPNTGGPRSCYMRYIDFDFPRDLEDRMELEARWRHAANRPQQFCHDPTATVPGKGCYEQIHVTDRKPPGPALLARPRSAARPVPIAPAGPESRWLAALVVPESPLSLEAAMDWEDLRVGDPLRFTVRLSWPSMMSAWGADLARRGTNAATPTFPSITADWPEGLRLELVRSDAGGGRTVLVPSGAWASWRRPLVADPAVLESRLGSWSREFLTDPAAVTLTPGEYVLSVVWDGRGRVDAALLPASGVLSGGELRFEVRPLADDRDRAAQLRRLAFQAWDRDEFDRARLHGREALTLAPDDVGRDAVDASWVVASANLALGDLRGSFEALRNLQRLSSSSGNGDPRTLATTWIDAISPSLRLERSAAPGVAPGLDVYGHAGQTYEVQLSTDLRNWSSLDRRTATQSPYRVADPGISGGTTARFYRVIWLP